MINFPYAVNMIHHRTEWEGSKVEVCRPIWHPFVLEKQLIKIKVFSSSHSYSCIFWTPFQRNHIHDKFPACRSHFLGALSDLFLALVQRLFCFVENLISEPDYTSRKWYPQESLMMLLKVYDRNSYFVNYVYACFYIHDFLVFIVLV